MSDKELQDKQLQEQNEKVASKDDFPINWIDRISLFLSHTIKYLIPVIVCLLYTSPSPRDLSTSRMPSSA